MPRSMDPICSESSSEKRSSSKRIVSFPDDFSMNSMRMNFSPMRMVLFSPRERYSLDGISSNTTYRKSSRCGPIYVCPVMISRSRFFCRYPHMLDPISRKSTFAIYSNMSAYRPSKSDSTDPMRSCMKSASFFRYE